jgi:hypothetical protein
LIARSGETGSGLEVTSRQVGFEQRFPALLASAREVCALKWSRRRGTRQVWQACTRAATRDHRRPDEEEGPAASRMPGRRNGWVLHSAVLMRVADQRG